MKKERVYRSYDEKKRIVADFYKSGMNQVNFAKSRVVCSAAVRKVLGL